MSDSSEPEVVTHTPLVDLKPAETVYIVYPEHIKPFDYETMGKEVEEILAQEGARKWLGEPLSAEALKAMAKGEKRIRAFGVIDKGDSGRCVGVIYVAPVGFFDYAERVWSCGVDTMSAMTITFVKADNAPKGIMSQACQEACKYITETSVDARGVPNRPAIIGIVDEENALSRAFLERNGFEDTGKSELKGHEKDHVYVYRV